jgi:hypothetical protein
LISAALPEAGESRNAAATRAGRRKWRDMMSSPSLA